MNRADPRPGRASLPLSRIGLVLLLLLRPVAARAAGLFDPTFAFHTLSTEHFRIYFHQGESRLAVRLSAIAERRWQQMYEQFGAMPPGRTHVVLVDQTDTSNGWATPLPYDTIMITAASPGGVEFIGRTDNWLDLVFTHEFTHIVHLDRSEGGARAVRAVFGRVPIAFPNLFLPIWEVEGIATYQESRLTGEGRLHAGDFRAIEQEAARSHRMEPLDRVNGGLTDWPQGTAAYAYGLGFHSFLADHYSEFSIAELTRETAGLFPFTQSRAFKRVYGHSLGTLWREYEAAAIAAAAPVPLDDHLSRLTNHGFVVAGPRIAPPACSTCPSQIVYSARDPHGFPALNAVGLDGSRPRQLTTRYLGSTSGVSATTIVYDQQEVSRNVSLHSDLYELDRTSGRVHRLTRGARLLDPDLSPDGRWIVCVREGNGQRDLVLIDRGHGAPSLDVAAAPAARGVVTLISEADTQFSAPRWSPDGQSIAAERRRLGALSEVVVVDVGSHDVRVVAAGASGRVITPAWRPDGRALVAAAEVGQASFNLYEFPIGPGQPRQLTHTTGGATWPDVAPDGRSLVFVGYTPAGFDLFSLAYPATSAGPDDTPFDAQTDASTASTSGAGPDAPESLVADAGNQPAYSPWPTLKPTFWSPVVLSDADQVRAGVATGGFDVLGYHAYSLSATWLLSGPATAAGPRHGIPDWQAIYAYSRWRPTFFASASVQTSFFAGSPTELDTSSEGTLQERQIEAGVFVPVRRVRFSHRALASIAASRDDYTLPGSRARISRVAARAGWATTTAHVYGYSISPESGVNAGVAAELIRRGFGADGDATTINGDFRAYVPGLAAHHVAALRIGGGTSTGAAAVRRVFLLGGSAASGDVVSYGSSALRLLRGFPSAAFAGNRVALINAEYRWPIARPQRGVGTWPLFLHTVHAAVFADVGHAWTRDFHARDVKASAGAELAFNVVAGYTFPFTATVGAARGHDGAASLTHWAAYVRLGRAF